MARQRSAARPGKVYSRDGTAIAFERSGDGPPLVLVDGALCYRASGPMRPLAARLADAFTVYTYDRRGRGESDNMLPYAVEREIEDLDALIDEAGGSAFVLGLSSGAALSLEAARHELAIRMLAMYEAPFIVDASRPPVSDDYVSELNALIAADRRADAVRLFMGIVGVPAVLIQLMRFMPAWSKLKAVAHTLPYEHGHRVRQPAGPGAASLVGGHHRADRRHRRRQEPGVDAQRDARRAPTSSPTRRT